MSVILFDPASPRSTSNYSVTDARAYVQEIFDREMGVTLSNSKAGSRRDEAMRELTREAAHLYSRRVLRELLQNAFDAAASATKPRILIRLDMTVGEHGTLYVANNGQGFTTENVDAISNPAMSNKTPGNFIGHKGLGFRSVELLSDDVAVYSKIDPASHNFDGFCFRFAAAEDELGWLERSGATAFKDVVVGRTHRLQLPVPLESVDPDIEAIAADGFTTLVCMPLKDDVAAGRAADEMRLLLNEKAPIVLFLERLHTLTLETIHRGAPIESKVLSRLGKAARQSSRGRDLIVEEVSVDRHRYLTGRMKVDDAGFRASIEDAVESGYRVERWRDWTGTPTVSIALPLSQDARTGTFYAFLPMDAQAPFNGCLDAPFHPDADRRDLDLSNPLNSFLLDSVADLCLALVQTLADEQASSFESASAAVDAIAWTGDASRFLQACERASIGIDSVLLPTVRKKDDDNRWAPIKDVFDWNDEAFRIITGSWLVRACGIPMVRRNLGTKRIETLRTFIDAVNLTFEPADTNWSHWAPILAKDLATRRRKATKEEWQNFYADLASLPAILPHLRGTAIFRLDDGRLAEANSPTTITERELFISPDPDNATRSRKRLTGTTLFPPKSIAQRMLFADPTLNWGPNVSVAFFKAGLATEYSLPRVIAGMGRLLGKRPSKQTVLAAINWAFTAWRAHKSNEVEAALKSAALPLPCADGKVRTAGTTRFGMGWRETRGDLLAEFCAALDETSQAAKDFKEKLLTPWEGWPLREKGTAAEWVQFLRLLGVRDGLTPVYYKAITMSAYEWWSVRSPSGKAIALEACVGPHWREALEAEQRGPYYQSGSYSTDDTLYALPLQGEHAQMSNRAKLAYARLVVAALSDMKEHHFTTKLRRTTGMSDVVNWTSPLLGFLRRASWLPTYLGDELSWKRPHGAWFAPRSDPLPRFLPRLDRQVRDAIDSSGGAREVFSKRLGLRLWNDRSSAPARIAELGDVLGAGIADHEQDNFRNAYRDAWEDWSALDPQPALVGTKKLVIQTSGRLAAYSPEHHETRAIFVGSGTDPALENLLMALGHLLLAIPAAAAKNAVAALSEAGFRNVRLAADIRPRIITDGEELDLSLDRPRLVDQGRDWLAEVAALVLEFNITPLGRNTPKSRHALYEDFRRLRVAYSRDIQVEIDGLTGALPPTLDGVLPVPDRERPTVVVRSADENISWPTLARMGRGIALALERGWLLTDFRMIFATLANSQLLVNGVVERPDDETLARAFGQSVERIREVLRSLRANNRRTLDWLIPVVAARFGHEAASHLLDHEHLLVEDGEIVAAMVTCGVGADDARTLLHACHAADGLDELRRDLAIPLSTFNAATAKLGSSFPQLRFENLLRQSFTERLDERTPLLREHVRNAFAGKTLDATTLEKYRAACKLEWAIFDDAWIATHDHLDDATIDQRIEDLAKAALPAIGQIPEITLDDARQANRVTLLGSLNEIQRLVSAWASKSQGRIAPDIWKEKPELLARQALASGVFDFGPIDPNGLPQALELAQLWPVGMPPSLQLGTLGLVADDLDRQAKAEQKRKDDEERRTKTVRFGTTDIVGGTNGSLQAVVEALREGLASKAFQRRSGPAILKPFPEGEDKGHRRTKRGISDKDPTYLTDQQRGLIGFAGEYASYVHLKRTVRNFADEHWISSMGRSFLCLPARQDEEGYDFCIPRSRGGLFFEVKAHIGDPGYVDLERSQVAAAVQFADEKRGIWKILYVTHVLDPSLITVHELSNPFSEKSMDLYRPSSRQGIRLLIDKK